MEQMMVASMIYTTVRAFVLVPGQTTTMPNNAITAATIAPSIFSSLDGYFALWMRMRKTIKTPNANASQQMANQL